MFTNKYQKRLQRVGWDARVGCWRDWFSLVAKLPELYCARRVPQVTFISPALMHIVYSPRASPAALNGPYHPPICIEAGPVDGVGGTVLISNGFLKQSVMSHDGHDQAEGGVLQFVEPPWNATVCSKCFWSASPYGMSMITLRSLARSYFPIPYGFPIRPATCLS
jgi:hypothetical protein